MKQLSAEIAEVRNQLRACAPFDLLAEELLAKAATSCRVVYRRAGEIIGEQGAISGQLHIIARGSAELSDSAGNLLGRVSEGEMIGLVSTLSGEPARHRCVTLEDSIMLQLGGDVLASLRRAADPAFDQHLVGLVAQRTQVGSRPELGDNLLGDRCERLVKRSPVVVSTSVSALDAAGLMTAERVSAVMVVDSERRVTGIVTDRDLRSRLIVAGVDPASTSIAEIMSPSPTTITGRELGHEALVVLTSQNIHHLPVVDDDDVPIGLITVGDLIGARTNDPVTIVGRIAKAASPRDVVAATSAVPSMVSSLMVADATAETTGRLVSTITDAVTQRLCQLAEAELGPPPVPYAFVCFGSQARQEQTAFTDQDNAIVVDDSSGTDSREADAYMAALAALVSDGLDACGYRYCPGDIMATNPRWRVELQTWKGYVDAWVAEPDPQAVLNAAVFFDVRHVYGEASLTKLYHHHAVDRAQRSDLFLGHLAASGAEFRPPLGFFRRFVLEKSGEQKDRLDLKRTGVTPVVHLARAYALKAGSMTLNSFDRIRAAGASPLVASADAENLAVAFEYVGYVRLQHQRRQLEQGGTADNFVDPDNLTRFEREQLRRAFVAIDAQQEAMRRSFNTGAMG